METVVEKEIEVGQEAPDFTLVDQNRRKLS
jgi:peroxiredoxin